MDINAEKLVAVYQKMTAKMSELEREQDAIKEQRKMVQNQLLEILKESGAEAMRTQYGTFYRTIRPSYTTTDWDSMYKFMVDHNAFHLMQQRIHSTNMKNFLEENPELLPPGLSSLSSYTIGVKKR